MDAFEAVSKLETSNVFEGDALSYFLEIYDNIFQQAAHHDDIEDDVHQFLEEASEQGLQVYNLQEDDTYPYIEENDAAVMIVSSALTRRKNEGNEVKNPAFAVISNEGHVFLISTDNPKTSSVVRVSA